MTPSGLWRKLDIILNPFKTGLPWHIAEFSECLTARNLKEPGKLGSAW